MIDKIMPNALFVYTLWFALIVIGEMSGLDSDHVSALMAAFGGSVATYALTLAKKEN